jgi:RNA polymerase sigma factor (sigma-70 family)
LSGNETLFSALAVRAQKGEKTAYAELLTGLRSFLANYLRRKIFEPNEIDDITQEILMAVHKSIHTYDCQKSFMSWFVAITEYKVIDYIRSLKRRHGSIDFNTISNFVMSTQLESSDAKIDLEKAISQLNLNERNVLTLLKVDGMSVADVSEKLELTEANVKVIAHRAYIKIKTLLGAQS